MNTNYSELEKIRLGSAILLGMAISRLYPDAQFGGFDLTEEGFYYDFMLSEEGVTEYELPAIQEEINALIEKGLPFRFSQKTKQEAVDFYSAINQPFKLETLEDIKLARVGFVTIGDNGYNDIVKQLPIHNSKEAGIVKVLSVAGAYWKGDENRPMLTRIYATAYPTKEEMELFNENKEEAQRRDHRVLGKKLDIYMTDQSIGSGLIVWEPRGAFIKNQLERFIYDTYLDNGFMPLDTPSIALKEIYEESGHIDSYSELMFGPWKEDETEEYYVKPMNYPMHMLSFASKVRSYRDLPWRTMEMGDVYRYEKNSDLHGLMKARGFTKDDCYTICSRDQLELEMESQFNLMLFLLRSFGLNDFEVILYSKMPKKIKNEGFDSEWDLAVSVLRNVVRKAGYNLKDSDVPSIFYGPKVEIVFRDSLKRNRNVSALALDIVTPKKMELEYTGKDGLQHLPYVIHRSIFGSFERFIGILLEHTAGNLPLWLQFEKCRIVPVNSKNEYYCETILKKCRDAGIIAKIDYSNEPLEGKIKQAEEDKIPYILVVGEKEQRVNGVAVRVQGTGDLGLVIFENFLASMLEEIKTKSIKTLLI